MILKNQLLLKKHKTGSGVFTFTLCKCQFVKCLILKYKKYGSLPSTPIGIRHHEADGEKRGTRDNQLPWLSLFNVVIASERGERGDLFGRPLSLKRLPRRFKRLIFHHFSVRLCHDET